MYSIGLLLAGLGGGAVIGALALGLVATYQSSGFVNFAHAAVGMFVAFAYFEFRSSGDLVLPLLGPFTRVHLLARPTMYTALIVALVLAAAIGAVIQILVVRPLRSAPPLASVVASLGLFLYFQEVTRIHFPVAGVTVAPRKPVLPTTPIRILGTTVSTDRLILTVVVVVVTVVLGVLFGRTRFGLATRAAAGEPRGALLLGISPDRTGVISWMIATALGGLAVILIEPISGLSTTSTPLLIVPAVAAALPGRFRSFNSATATALAIGMSQSLILGWLVHPSMTWIPKWLPTTGVQQAVPLIVIIVLLARRGDALPDRMMLFGFRQARSPHPRHVALTTVVTVAVALAALVLGDATLRHAVIVSTIAVLMSLSVVVVTGYTGQISLAPLALAGVAGFASIHMVDRGVPFVVALILGGVIAAIVGTAVAWPATRVRGMTLGIATLAVAVAIEQLVLASRAVSGGVGGSKVPRPDIFGWDVGISDLGSNNFRAEFGIVCVITVAIAAVAVANARRNPTGLRWLAVRANERAAAAAGIDVARVKLGAFALSSSLAGLAGVLMAFSVTTLSPTSFMVIGSLVVVSFTYLCGVASIGGAILAGVIAQGGIATALMSGGVGEDPGSMLAWTGLALIVATIFAPDGVTGLLGREISNRFGRSGGSAAADSNVGESTEGEPNVGGSTAIAESEPPVSASGPVIGEVSG